MAEQFDYESFQDNQTIGKYLQAIIDGFEKGKIVFDSEKDHIELHPKNLLKVSIKARRKDDKSKLEIKISWKNSKKELKENKIHISS